MNTAKPPGKRIRRAGLVLCLLLAWSWPAAQAQDARPVRLVVPAPPGGNLDQTARLLVQRLGALTGDAYVVENRPGANTQIGTELVVRAPADGRVLLLAGTGLAFMSLLQKASFSPLDDLAPVIQVTVERYVLVVPAASPIGAAQDLHQAAAHRADGLNCVAAPGATTLACEQLKAHVGGKLTTVPYAGVAQAMSALLGGHADVMFVTREVAGKLVASGRLRVLAHSSLQGALPAAAPAPLLSDLWPGFFLEGWSGVLAPAGTPKARLRQLNREFNQLLADPEVAAAMHTAGQEPAGGSAERYGDDLRRSHERYGEVIRRLGLGYR